MAPGGRKKILMFHQHPLLLRTYALLLERRGYQVAAVDSTMQMILKLEAEEDCFDGLLIEVSSELRQNPSNFVRFVKETLAISRPPLILSGWARRKSCVPRVRRESRQSLSPWTAKNFCLR
jgi:hypothetical protein